MSGIYYYVLISFQLSPFHLDSYFLTSKGSFNSPQLGVILDVSNTLLSLHSKLRNMLTCLSHGWLCPSALWHKREQVFHSLVTVQGAVERLLWYCLIVLLGICQCILSEVLASPSPPVTKAQSVYVWEEILHRFIENGLAISEFEKRKLYLSPFPIQ